MCFFIQIPDDCHFIILFLLFWRQFTHFFDNFTSTSIYKCLYILHTKMIIIGAKVKLKTLEHSKPLINLLNRIVYNFMFLKDI